MFRETLTLQQLKDARGHHIIHLNARSIRNKIAQLRAELGLSNIGAITISESWLGERDHDKFYEIHEVQYTDQK